MPKSFLDLLDEHIDPEEMKIAMMQAQAQVNAENEMTEKAFTFGLIVGTIIGVLVWLF